jgi:hypothetical protein
MIEDAFGKIVALIHEKYLLFSLLKFDFKI